MAPLIAPSAIFHRSTIRIELGSAIKRTVTIPRRDAGKGFSSAQVVSMEIAMIYLVFALLVLALRGTTDPLPGSSGA
jgi:hypothetical protein